MSPSVNRSAPIVHSPSSERQSRQVHRSPAQCFELLSIKNGFKRQSTWLMPSMALLCMCHWASNGQRWSVLDHTVVSACSRYGHRWFRGEGILLGKPHLLNLTKSRHRLVLQNDTLGLGPAATKTKGKSTSRGDTVTRSTLSSRSFRRELLLRCGPI